MAEEARSRRARANLRSVITRTVNSVTDALALEDPEIELLMAKLQRLEELEPQLIELDQRILDAMYDAEATDAQLEEENGDNESINGTQRRNFKLPKIELKKFNGEYEEWLGWWSQFSKIHEDESLHEADKFHYLMQAMTPNTRAHNLIKSYPPTTENYPKVIEALKDQFGDKSLLAEVYIRKLQNIVLGLDKSKPKFDLCQIYDQIETQLRCLESLEIVLDHSAFMLPLIESTLPIDLIKVWQRTSESGYLDDEQKTTAERLRSLMKFLKREVKGEERIKMITGSHKEEKNQGKGKDRRDKDVPTAQSLFAGTSACIFCAKTNHASPDCLKATHMAYEEIQKKVKEGRACFKCVKKGHGSKECKTPVKCNKCGKAHHTFMCRGSQFTPETLTQDFKSLSTNPNASVANACHIKEGFVLMKTVQVDLLNNNGQKYRVRLLFDEGSNRSYIRTSTAEKLNCKMLEEFQLQTTLFGGQTTVRKPKKMYRVTLHCIDQRFKGRFELINEDTICGNCPTIPKGLWLKELSKQNIVVNDVGNCNPEIEILIGSDFWPHLMTGKMIKLENGLIAVESVFGWTISGKFPSKQNKEETMCSTVIAMLTQGEKTLPDMWDLETIGISDPVEKLSQKEHDEVVKVNFKKKITRDADGRYRIELPWIDRDIPLPNYKNVCEKTLQSLTNRLKKEDLYATYNKIFRDWEEEGIIERCNMQSEPEHYLPHHRVLKPDSKTTPVRPVFNASFKTGNNPSLNECLERGPNLLELIPTVLTRFRMKDIGVISDIRKAFQMIGVAERDKNYQKFLWWEEGEEDHEEKSGDVSGVDFFTGRECGLETARLTNWTPPPPKIKMYRHARVVFGMNCSPFILAVVLEHHFDQQIGNFGEIVQQLQDSIYVDNSIVSLDSIEEYKKFRETSIAILADAKMDLREWESNCEQSSEDSTNVLGLVWNKKSDTLACKINLKTLEDPVKISKRSVLSIISQVFDPIGFTTPAMLHAKLMLQSSWAMQCEWDQEWEPTTAEMFRQWHKEIGEISRIEIPRIAIGSFSSELQLHLFTDASQDAYAAVIYTRVKLNGKVRVELLQAKSRLAPLPKKTKMKKSDDSQQQTEVTKRVTIPRLELLGCFIGSRLLNSVQESLKLENIPVFCWSDSTTALAWIKRDENWGTFVGNRVREINRLSNKENWRHVPGHLNPADLPSRGWSPYELRQSKWWEGPSWLYESEDDWPNATPLTEENLVQQELKKTEEPIIANATVVEVVEPRFGTYAKNVRVAAWVRKFINASRKLSPLKNDKLTMEEMRLGEIDLLREIQNRHFPNKKLPKNVQAEILEDGLLHMQTRLRYSGDKEHFKCPILLPSKDPLVLQLIEFVHRMYCHAGTQFVLNALREKYWILQGRRTVNSVIHKCVTCRRFDAKNLQVDPAPLPSLRIETNSAFQTTGVDLAGPVILKGGKKCWIVLYTCAVYRGIYLDIVDSLTSEEFINSLHKFTCIIGRPNTMFSDNGTNFVGTQTLMKKINWNRVEEMSQVKQIVWRFNPPTAAWWGGWWERMVRSIKDLLRRMIFTAKLTRKELETCMSEISLVINNRPLTTLTENESDLIPLTPAMFMRDLPLTGLPEVEKMTGKDFQEAFKRLNGIKEALKRRFRKEYLANLIQKKSEKTTPDPKVGDVVLVGYDNKKRFEWPMGRILELFPGKDQKIRVAKVKTARVEF